MDCTLPAAPHGYVTFYCNHCGNTFKAPIHCTSRTCLFCLSARRFRIRRRIAFALQHHEQTGTHRWRHVILTIRNQDDLKSMIDHLIASFRKLRQRRLWKHTQSAAFYVIEVKRGVDGWHPHLHVISYGTYLPIRSLRSTWNSITKDSFYCYITWIKDGTDIAWYVTKYITKLDDPDNQYVAEIDRATRHRRLFGATGDAGKLLRDYKFTTPVYLCPICHSHEWIPEFVMNFYKRTSVRVRPPPNDWRTYVRASNNSK